MPRLAAVPRIVRSEPVASDRDRASPEAAAVPGLVFQLTSRAWAARSGASGTCPLAPLTAKAHFWPQGTFVRWNTWTRWAVHDGGLPAGRGAAGRLAPIGLCTHSGARRRAGRL